jgi:hypothetical protein
MWQDVGAPSVDQRNGDALPFSFRKVVSQRNRIVGADDKTVYSALQKLRDVASLSRCVETRVPHPER